LLGGRVVPLNGNLSKPQSAHTRRKDNDGRSVHALTVIIPLKRVNNFANCLLPFVRGQAVHDRMKRDRNLPELFPEFLRRSRPRPFNGAELFLDPLKAGEFEFLCQAALPSELD
jgi:hypothetical protein